MDVERNISNLLLSLVTLSCGATTTENCTYLNQDASNTPATDDGDENLSCTYTICPATTSIRRIRLELSVSI